MLLLLLPRRRQWRRWRPVQALTCRHRGLPQVLADSQTCWQWGLKLLLLRLVDIPAPHGVAVLALIGRQAARSRLGLRRLRQPLQLPEANVQGPQASHRGLSQALADSQTCCHQDLPLALCAEIAASGGQVQTCGSPSDGGVNDGIASLSRGGGIAARAS